MGGKKKKIEQAPASKKSRASRARERERLAAGLGAARSDQEPSIALRSARNRQNPTFSTPYTEICSTSICETYESKLCWGWSAQKIQIKYEGT
jgi:hypothetical protein